MNKHLARLHFLAQQPSRRIIGLMSGTSLDGLDVALCKLEGHGLATKLTLEHFATVPYTDDVRHRIREVFAGGPNGQVDLEYLTLLNPWLGLLHADMVLACLREWQIPATEVDLLASHGQTVYHAPQHQHQRPDFPLNATLQLGDGDHVAVRTGIITLSDFRQKHIAAGGEGAPLAAYGDYLLLSSPKEERLLLNLGGIANFTYLPRIGQDTSTAFSTDTGPGNTLLDATVRAHRPSLAYDEDGKLAAAGQVHTGLLQALLAHPFFTAAPPKTTGPELFHAEYLRQAQMQSGTEQLGLQDLLATLTELSAASVAQAVTQAFGRHPSLTVYASGGGAHNPSLQAALQRYLPYCRLSTTEQLGILPDAKEAVLFAVLANEAVAGEPLSIGAGRQRVPAVTMGKISLPG
ncbi:anhydro-N-acetylmuramic acid kinase [Hymenobacter sp. BT186]|uniref:Anhydro-N-acetylmuramic acid kinase n=1 Tax=Hymenobacter telluris TaxID=2816474 RepID=A0A939ETZ1_9BACT|nr:anhydro-N-acetylmuramic acid kinase [Hymenobacter telluris]MBO0357182.1 anhydro-N-acetylmuramic acid kinase [Hymenobacter telluris]MBW3373208.1 anhydro-N-acetylmuramic acid kinase [Hymenobacter norwichensis]